MRKTLDNAGVEREIVDVHGDGETVLMLLRATGTASYSEIAIEVEWAAIWTVRGGKLLRAQGYLDRAEALEAAGLRESKGAHWSWANPLEPHLLVP